MTRADGTTGDGTRGGSTTRADGTTEHLLDRTDLLPRATALLDAGHRLALVAGHDDGDRLRVVYAFAHAADDERTELVVEVPTDDAWVPSLAAVSFPAGRFERALRDQFGIEPAGHPRPRRLVHHAHWPDGWYPMRRDAAEPRFRHDAGAFEFIAVQGDGVFEIPVGPVHAGMIEPGHFRFSVVGETILRMKARLWFVHRGVEKLFTGLRPADGVALAERISGDTAVGHALGYAMAVEGALGVQVAEQDRVVRALLLELERLHNHVADLGMLCNDVGFGIVNVHAQRLRETLLRVADAITGHRLARGGVLLGGSRLLATPEVATIRRVGEELAELVDLALGTSMVLDRLRGTAVLPHAAAAAIGVLGYVARASGLDLDARRDHPFVDLDPARLGVVATDGDVLARFGVRAREAAHSVELIADLAERLDGRLGTGTSFTDEDVERHLHGVPSRGLCVVEAWRGTACHRVELGADGRLTRAAVVDPSFFTWPALPVSLADTIVPDFPLANKSFNQSYAGNDL